MKKTIYIHMGPHKTGSTSIQKFIRQNARLLRKFHNVEEVPLVYTKKIVEHIRLGSWQELREVLAELNNYISECQCEAFLWSSEDLSGDLPGRRGGKKPYYHLGRVVSEIQEALHGANCYFYFFRREPSDWLESAFAQHLKYRSRFRSAEEFKSWMHFENLWDKVIQGVQCDNFFVLDFKKFKKDDALGVVRVLADAIPVLDQLLSNEGVTIGELRENVTPPRELVEILECIANSGASDSAKAAARAVIRDSFDNTEQISGAKKERTLKETGSSRSVWPPILRVREDFPERLLPLLDRSRARVLTQSQPDILPDITEDLRPYSLRVVRPDGEWPQTGRSKIEDQAAILKHRFSGLPESSFLLGLTISYLRRNTPVTEKAKALFTRLWEEEYDVLLGVLPARWLISSLQTYFDHGSSEAQKIIGASGYFYANMIKIYEGERSIDGLSPEGNSENTTPVTESGFIGLDRYKIGATDLLLNTNALLLEISLRDEASGRVLQEFILRTAAAHNVFTRHDRYRKRHNINEKPFSNCWSFFNPPS
ncbi:hypothetical protein [Rhodobacter capsulatus]|uniref:hypothetical protein n=1 Tax=Rhodobacter capsulatus TaxID=1061 RepID=UPI0010402EC0|nr:hypothetical protein [Rhodobacter capsulatus]